MTDYIIRDAAIEAMYEDAEEHPEHTFWFTQHKALRNIPAADVRPVVKARWNVGADGWECSNCAIESNNTYPICPYCGADMREES